MAIMEASVPNEWLTEITPIITGKDIDWKYLPNTAGQYKSTGKVSILEKSSPQMVHMLYSDHKPQSIFFDKFLEVFNHLQISCSHIFRMKLNLTFPNNVDSSDVFNQAHVDIDSQRDAGPPIPYRSLLIYLTDSDGDTIFFDNDNNSFRATYEKGKAIDFESGLLHAGQNPSNGIRIVLNTVYIP